jgi:hypothetical protein
MDKTKEEVKQILIKNQIAEVLDYICNNARLSFDFEEILNSEKFLGKAHYEKRIREIVKKAINYDFLSLPEYMLKSYQTEQEIVAYAESKFKEKPKITTFLPQTHPASLKFNNSLVDKLTTHVLSQGFDDLLKRTLELKFTKELVPEKQDFIKLYLFEKNNFETESIYVNNLIKMFNIVNTAKYLRANDFAKIIYEP